MKTMLRLLLVFLLLPPIVLSQGRFMREKSAGVHFSRLARKASPIVLNKVTGVPLPAGSYTVGLGGTFPTIDSAFRRLETGGIAGAVTLLLKDTLYVAPFPPGDFRLVGPIGGAGPSSGITIRPADNVAVTIKGSGTATVTFEDVSYLTLDGISLEGPTRLKVHTSVNTSYPSNDAIDLWGDCNHVTVQNLTAGSDRIDLMTTAILLISRDTSSVDSCVVSGVSITSGGTGIGVTGYYSLKRPQGNIIRGNYIGSPNDSLISQGIGVIAADGTIVEENHVEHLVQNLVGGVGNWPSVTGINSFHCSNTIIRSNIVHGLRGTAGGGLYAIIVSGETSKIGQGVQVYNNMVYDLANRDTTTDGYITGIILWYNSSVLIAYNTVALSGTSADGAGSDALALVDGMTNTVIRNNILVNSYHITGTGGSTALWVAQDTSFTSDHNDLFVDTTFTNSALVYQLNVGGYRALSQWQGAGYDAHSVSVMPKFVGPQDLHLKDTLTELADAAIPLAGITQDIDGDPRPRPGDIAPDIGADEFRHPLGVDNYDPAIPQMFAMEQNYPNPFNPTTVVSYQLPAVSDVRLVVYDLLGREVAVLVSEKKAPGSYQVKFDAAGLASGVYLYRLITGDFTRTKKMMVLK